MIKKIIFSLFVAMFVSFSIPKIYITCYYYYFKEQTNLIKEELSKVQEEITTLTKEMSYLSSKEKKLRCDNTAKHVLELSYHISKVDFKQIKVRSYYSKLSKKCNIVMCVCGITNLFLIIYFSKNKIFVKK